MGLDASMTVEVPLHVPVHEESFTTHVARITHVTCIIHNTRFGNVCRNCASLNFSRHVFSVTCVLSEVLFQVLLFPVLPLTSRELALIPKR